MWRCSVFVASVVIAGCQLADPIDAPKCQPGFHPELQKCVADDVTSKQIKIIAADGGTACSDPAAQRAPLVEPATLTVKSGEEFQFQNADVVPHEIRGVAGEV